MGEKTEVRTGKVAAVKVTTQASSARKQPDFEKALKNGNSEVIAMAIKEILAREDKRQ